MRGAAGFWVTLLVVVAILAAISTPHPEQIVGRAFLRGVGYHAAGRLFR